MFSTVAEILDGDHEKKNVSMDFSKNPSYWTQWKFSVFKMCTADVDLKNAETGLLPQILVYGYNQLMIHLC